MNNYAIEDAAMLACSHEETMTLCVLCGAVLAERLLAERPLANGPSGPAGTETHGGTTAKTLYLDASTAPNDTADASDASSPR